MLALALAQPALVWKAQRHMNQKLRMSLDQAASSWGQIEEWVPLRAGKDGITWYEF